MTSDAVERLVTMLPAGTVIATDTNVWIKDPVHPFPWGGTTRRYTDAEMAGVLSMSDARVLRIGIVAVTGGEDT